MNAMLSGCKLNENTETMLKLLRLVSCMTTTKLM